MGRKRAMSLIRVYLLAKTFVFRNEHFQFVFKLKTILLKIRAPVPSNKFAGRLDFAGFYFLNVPLILNAPLNLLLLTNYYVSTSPDFHLVMEEA